MLNCLTRSSLASILTEQFIQSADKITTRHHLVWEIVDNRLQVKFHERVDSNGTD